MSTITENNIHSAADKLTADGVTPTLAKVREELGGGSFTKISDAMKKWRENNAPDAVAVVAVPDAVTAECEAMAANIWASAVAYADKKFKGERLVFESEIEQLRVDMQAKIDEAVGFAESVSADNEKLRVDMDKLRAGLTKSKALVKARDEKIKTLDATIKELAAKIPAANPNELDDLPDLDITP